MVGDLLEFAFLAFLLISTSLFYCGALSGRRITAERAFWLGWVFMMLSAETVSSFEFFEYPYPVDVVTRSYSLEVIMASAAGFMAATTLAASSRATLRAMLPQAAGTRAAFFRERTRYLTSSFFFLMGLVEFATVITTYGNLLDVRLAALVETHADFQLYLYLFYVCSGYILMLGCVDAARGGGGSKMPAYIAIAGLALHGLSIGGRINVLLGPLFYVVPYLLYLDYFSLGNSKPYRRARVELARLMVVVVIAFSLIAMMRSYNTDFSQLATIEGILQKVIFSVPKYVSDSYVSISTHANHALQGNPPFGQFTFDAIYRLLLRLGFVSESDPNLFGHLYYRNTPAPWAWTQVNFIPRMIADFGEGTYLIAVFCVMLAAQWISLTLPGKSPYGHSVASLAIICNLYSIQASMWFSAWTVIVLASVGVIGFLSRRRGLALTM